MTDANGHAWTSHGSSERGYERVGVAGAVAVRGGDVGAAVQAQEADGQAAQRCHDVGCVLGSDQGFVFLVGGVADLLRG